MIESRKEEAALKPDAVPTLFTKQVTSKETRDQGRRVKIHFCTPSINLEAILSGKLLKNVLMVSYYGCVYVMFMTIATMT